MTELGEWGTEYERILLERQQFVAHQYISRELADWFAIPPKVDFSLHDSFVFDHILLQIKQSIMGREMQSETVRYPADWWEAVKARWFPAWAKRRWPVHETVVELTALELYPKIALPDQEHYIVVNKWERKE